MPDDEPIGKIYRGMPSSGTVWTQRGCVYKRLNPRFDLRKHSPTGFSWGFSGSGPAQLSLAILANALGDDARALHLYQRFKFKVIAALPGDRPWRMTLIEVLHHVHEIERAGVKRHQPEESEYD